MVGNFSQNQIAAVEFVYYKRDSPKLENGVEKEITPLAIVGNRARLGGESVKNLHWKSLKGALRDILSSVSKEIHYILYNVT